MNALGHNERETAELGRELRVKIEAAILVSDLTEALIGLIADVNQARQWLREGASGKALEVLDAAKERLNDGN